MKHHTKKEYLDFFQHMEKEDKKCILGGQAWDEINWWVYYAIDKDQFFTLKELKEKFPYLLNKTGE